jgi:hypothetical protein
MVTSEKYFKKKNRDKPVFFSHDQKQVVVFLVIHMCNNLTSNHQISTHNQTLITKTNMEEKVQTYSSKIMEVLIFFFQTRSLGHKQPHGHQLA